MKKHKQHGSALVIAIFIIVVMTLLGTALVRMLSTSAESVVYEVVGTRAFNAAQTGMQWQLQQLFPLGNPTQLSCAVIPISPPDISNTSGLENCSIISLSCSAQDVENIKYYTLRSTGQCEVADIITSRTLEVTARTL